MQKVAVELSTKEAEQLVDQLVERLNPAAQLRLTQKLERITRRARWEPLVLKMRRQAARLSPHEMQQLCETVRQERYERRQRARSP